MLHPAAIFVQIRTMGKGEWRRVFVEECYHCVFKLRVCLHGFVANPKSRISKFETNSNIKITNPKQPV